MSLSLVDAVTTTAVPGGGRDAIVWTVDISALVNMRKNRGRMHLASEIGPVPVPAMMFRLLLGSSMAGHFWLASKVQPTVYPKQVGQVAPTGEMVLASSTSQNRAL